MVTVILNEPKFICLLIVNWFQVLLSDPTSSVCTQLKGFKYSNWLDSSIWPIDGTSTSTTPPQIKVVLGVMAMKG